MRPKRVYYAHSILLYDTPKEEEELQVIKKNLRNVEIINPKNIKSDTMGMEPYLRTVETCDILVFSRFNGMITAGVGAKVNHALKHGKVVYEIKGNKLGRINEPVEYLTYEETRLLYGGWL